MEWEECVSGCYVVHHDGVRVRCSHYFLDDDVIAFEGGVGLVCWYPE